MSDFISGLTLGLILGAGLVTSIAWIAVRCIENHPLPAKATRTQLMAEYGHDIAKYKRYTDAEVLRIIKDWDDDSNEVIENLSDDQLNRLLAQVTDEDVKDDLEMEKLARTIDDD